MNDFADEEGSTKCPSCGHQLGTPARQAGSVRSSLGLANAGGRAISLARRFPVREQTDMIVSRMADGSSVIRHKAGGAEIGQLRRNDDGKWVPVVDGKELSPYNQQRSAVMAMIGTYNRATGPAGPPLQAPPEQTALMQQFGVPAIRLAADDSSDSGDGPADDDDTSGNGLNPRGQGIYKKLVSKGVKPAVAMAMAKRAQAKVAGSFGGK